MLAPRAWRKGLPCIAAAHSSCSQRSASCIDICKLDDPHHTQLAIAKDHHCLTDCNTSACKDDNVDLGRCTYHDARHVQDAAPGVGGLALNPI